ncbi:hypothetical protein TSOC_004015 [Tetrabaena socialis]|uniref:Uncharacterized protein n=1 Tax=Tetrabaena socialis TaxID=47790 RepID=A0A2J8AA64_9CHLO|nr:hypothetical protein TSOC_004015 [Tetrabaena socialis]|eukprot:PNH09373.1 hypothetical protein TSOC_004015 [Tetrabaena socialis]
MQLGSRLGAHAQGTCVRRCTCPALALPARPAPAPPPVSVPPRRASVLARAKRASKRSSKKAPADDTNAEAASGWDAALANIPTESGPPASSSELDEAALTERTAEQGPSDAEPPSTSEAAEPAKPSRALVPRAKKPPSTVMRLAEYTMLMEAREDRAAADEVDRKERAAQEAAASGGSALAVPGRTSERPRDDRASLGMGPRPGGGAGAQPPHGLTLRLGPGPPAGGAVAAQGDVELFFVSCGNTADMPGWLQYTAFPGERTLLDQANAVYDALGTRRGVVRTLLHPYMWLVLPFRLAARGTLSGLGRAMRVWRPLVPEKKVHSFLQGGTFVFRGSRLLWSHLNAVPGDEPPLEEVLIEVRKGLGGGPARQA